MIHPHLSIYQRIFFPPHFLLYICPIFVCAFFNLVALTSPRSFFSFQLFFIRYIPFSAFLLPARFVVYDGFGGRKTNISLIDGFVLSGY